jgi:translation initiation factor IF-3
LVAVELIVDRIVSTWRVQCVLIARRPTIRFFDRQPAADRGPRINEQIRISPIRLIGAEGEQLGLVPTVQALEKARAAGLDLVEVAADERPPVCKILDFGKMRFANSQKGNKAGRVRQQKLKELRLRPRTGDHDVETKAAQARKFLEHNDKVQLTVTFRGREMQHVQEGRRVLDGVIQTLADVGKVERPPSMDGKRMTVMLMPTKPPTKAKPPKPKTPDSKGAQVSAASPTRGTVGPEKDSVEPKTKSVELVKEIEKRDEGKSAAN